LLSLPVGNVALAFRIGHSFVATLRVLRQLILKRAAFAVGHLVDARCALGLSRPSSRLIAALRAESTRVTGIA